jgi:hypothetical protein
MKNSIIFLLTLQVLWATGQENLYVSLQTLQVSEITDQDSAKTDDNESGECTCTSTGPIAFNISPMAIGHNSEILVTGWVKPTIENAPQPGTTADASITCSCTWRWLTWDDVTQSKTKQMSDSKTETRHFPVVSIFIDIPDTIECQGGEVTITADVYPGDVGSIEWESPAGSTSGESVTFNVEDITDEFIPIRVKYNVNGVTYSDEGVVKNDIGRLTGYDLPFCMDASPGTQISTSGLGQIFYEGCRAPEVTYQPAFIEISEGEMTESFTITVSDGNASFSDEIILVNPEIKWGSPQLAAIESALNILEDVTNMVNEFTELVANYSPGFSVEPEFELERDLNLEFNTNCCDSVILEGVDVSIDLSASVSIAASATMFLPPIPPLIAYVDLSFGFGISASVGVHGEIKCPPNSICGTMSFSTSGSITGSLHILAGLVNGTVSVNANLLSGSAELCVTYEPLDATLQGELQIGGLSITAQVCAGIGFFTTCFPEEPQVYQIAAPYSMPINLP